MLGVADEWSRVCKGTVVTQNVIYNFGLKSCTVSQCNFFLNGRLAVRTVERDFKHETTAFVNLQALASLRRIFKRINRNWIKVKLDQWNAMSTHSALCTNAGESSVNLFL